MRRLAVSLLVVCLFVPHAWPQQAQVSAGSFIVDGHVNDRTAISDSEKVAFNTNSLKYHCPSCSAAKRCTVNCITVTRAEAKRRGGVPCKICGGRC